VKVCDLTQFYSPVSGGVRRYIAQKAEFVRAMRPGWQHVLVVPGESTGMTGDDVCRTYTIASPLVSRTSRYRMLLKLHLVEEVLEREMPDIIESGDPYQLSWKAVASGRGLGIPVVGFYHSHFPEALLRTVAKFTSPVFFQIARDSAQRYVKTLYNHFRTTFVPSPALAALLASWGVERTEAIDLGVDTAIFCPGDPPPGLREKLGIPDGCRVLLYVGRLAPEKNVGVLFSAFTELSERAPGRYHLVVVGDGTWRPHLLRLRESTGHLSWVPYCSSPRELAGFYRCADLFVHPGIQETFGLVTLESQACATPVVGIRGSYMDRIIFSDQFHWARENSPRALADAIESKFGSDLAAMGAAASRAVRDRFSWNHAFERIFSAYSRIISEDRG